MASQQDLSGVNSLYTLCQFQNHTAQVLTLKDQKNWHGHGDAPKSIPAQNSGNFTNYNDSVGSVAGVAYDLEKKCRWITAWSNAQDDHNKVYTQIVDITEQIDWPTIRNSLGQSGNESIDKELGYTSIAKIDPTSSTPTMTATLSPAAAPAAPPP